MAATQRSPFHDVHLFVLVAAQSHYSDPTLTCLLLCHFSRFAFSQWLGKVVASATLAITGHRDIPPEQREQLAKTMPAVRARGALQRLWARMPTARRPRGGGHGEAQQLEAGRASTATACDDNGGNESSCLPSASHREEHAPGNASAAAEPIANGAGRQESAAPASGDSAAGGSVTAGFGLPARKPAPAALLTSSIYKHRHGELPSAFHVQQQHDASVSSSRADRHSRHSMSVSWATAFSGGMAIAAGGAGGEERAGQGRPLRLGLLPTAAASGSSSSHTQRERAHIRTSPISMLGDDDDDKKELGVVRLAGSAISACGQSTLAPAQQRRHEGACSISSGSGSANGSPASSSRHTASLSADMGGPVTEAFGLPTMLGRKSRSSSARAAGPADAPAPSGARRRSSSGSSELSASDSDSDGSGKKKHGESDDPLALEKLLAQPATRRAIGFSETPVLSFFLVAGGISAEEIDLLEEVEHAYMKRGMFYRMVGYHRVDSLFNVRLDAGELMPFFMQSFRRRERYFPPHGDFRTPRGGISLGQHAQFLVVFPLSSCAFRALHGWAAARVRRHNGRRRRLLAAATVAPACAVLFAVQLFAAFMGIMALLGYYLFASLFTMCVYGDSKVRRPAARSPATLLMLRNLAFCCFANFL